jgi:quercetin dioxygenase-like cupin family protein
VRAGTTLVIPPGVPHQLLNHLWTPATLLVTYPSAELETEPLD